MRRLMLFLLGPLILLAGDAPWWGWFIWLFLLLVIE
jgi:hypothetical protein